MNYGETLEYLYAKTPMYQKKGDVAYKEGLDNILRLDGIFGHPHHAYKTIHIAGTNGKGSTVGMLESIYRAAGYKTCAHTSPHLLRFNERARINGVESRDEDLMAAFAEVEGAREGTLSYFEYTALGILRLFQKENPDVVILEIGLGGRLDAINTIDSDAAVISTIGIDHTAFLGNTREAIASEKAYIYRPGCPAVCSDADVPSTLSAYVEKIGAKGIYAGRDFRTVVREDGTFDWEGEGVRLEKLPRPALLGVNQYRNAAGVLAVVTALQGKLPVAREAIEKGLETVRLTARFETVSQDPCPIVLDVGHNPEAAAVLAENIRLTKREGERTMAVFGMLADKDMEGVARLLKDSFDDWFIASLTGPRAASATLLKSAMLRAGVPEDRIESYTTVEAALAQARFVAKNLSERPSGTVRIIVFGSFVTVTAALEALAAHA